MKSDATPTVLPEAGAPDRLDTMERLLVQMAALQAAMAARLDKLDKLEEIAALLRDPAVQPAPPQRPALQVIPGGLAEVVPSGPARPNSRAAAPRHDDLATTMADLQPEAEIIHAQLGEQALGPPRAHTTPGRPASSTCLPART